MLRRASALLCVFVVAFLAPVGARAADDWQLPNLSPLPAQDLEISYPDSPAEGTKALRFSTLVRNIGDRIFDLALGQATNLEEGRFEADQCVRWNGRLCDERVPAGELYFENHVDHFHWHYDQFVLYELRNISGGVVDWSPAGLVASVVKRSFCMEDSEPNDGPATIDTYTHNPPFYLTCLGVEQGISPGWLDKYGADLFGQEIVIDGVADGDYALVEQVNFGGHLHETTLEDNTSVQLLRISANASQVIPLD